LEQYFVPLREPARPATTPVGRAGSPMNTPPGRPPQNSPGNVCGRDFTGHAFDRMQGRGFTPSVVLDALGAGQRSPGSTPYETLYYSPSNNLTVVTNTMTGAVVTVRNGPPSAAPGDF
jgi:hypothetical protein